jgi:hypothetical protein
MAATGCKFFPVSKLGLSDSTQIHMINIVQLGCSFCSNKGDNIEQFNWYYEILHVKTDMGIL